MTPSLHFIKSECMLLSLQTSEVCRRLYILVGVNMYYREIVQEITYLAATFKVIELEAIRLMYQEPFEKSNIATPTQPKKTLKQPPPAPKRVRFEQEFNPFDEIQNKLAITISGMKNFVALMVNASHGTCTINEIVNLDTMIYKLEVFKAHLTCNCGTCNHMVNP